MSEFKRHNFKKLKIWLMSMELSKIILNLTDTFPVSEKYGLKRQALHSYKLEVELYWENKIFFWELKDDIKKLIKNI